MGFLLELLQVAEANGAAEGKEIANNASALRDVSNTLVKLAERNAKGCELRRNKTAPAGTYKELDSQDPENISGRRASAFQTLRRLASEADTEQDEEEQVLYRGALVMPPVTSDSSRASSPEPSPRADPCPSPSLPSLSACRLDSAESTASNKLAAEGSESPAEQVMRRGDPAIPAPELEAFVLEPEEATEAPTAEAAGKKQNETPAEAPLPFSGLLMQALAAVAASKAGQSSSDSEAEVQRTPKSTERNAPKTPEARAVPATRLAETKPRTPMKLTLKTSSLECKLAKNTFEPDVVLDGESPLKRRRCASPKQKAIWSPERC